MSKPIGVVQFLGTNCDRDVWQALEASGLTPQWCWYENTYNVDDFSGFVLPGGFSYGDYVRSGALASKAPVMETIRQAADRGLPVLGICNGFQILCDSGILPGALLKNKVPRFIDRWVELETVSGSDSWGGSLGSINIPIAHGEGRFYAEPATLDHLESNNQVWLRYKENPNGSANDIAGIKNAKGNVAGLMPHPERAMFDWMGGTDGKRFFSQLGGQ